MVNDNIISSITHLLFTEDIIIPYDFIVSLAENHDTPIMFKDLDNLYVDSKLFDKLSNEYRNIVLLAKGVFNQDQFATYVNIVPYIFEEYNLMSAEDNNYFIAMLSKLIALNSSYLMGDIL